MTEPNPYRFPGMDPWLETPQRWTSIHDRLIIYIADEVAAQVGPRYSARPGQRLIVEEVERLIVPDVAVTESGAAKRGERGAAVADIDTPVIVHLPAVEYPQSFLEITDLESGGRVVTVVEVLSPTNKRSGTDARDKYLQKQAEVLRGGVSLVEVDLLRGGEHTVSVPVASLEALRPYHYLVVARRATRREEAEVFAIPLARRLPSMRIPLLRPDPDVLVDLQSLVERAYVLGGYARTIDYVRPPDPPLDESDQAWARERIAAAGGA